MNMQIPLAFLVGTPGGGELLVIFIAVLLLFGPKKLPEVARNLGKAMEYLRRTSQDFRDQVMKIEDETGKTIESTMKEAGLSGQSELSLDDLASSTPVDPYKTVGMLDSSAPTEPGQVISTTTEQENAAKTDTPVAGSPQDVQGGKIPDGGQAGGLAG